MTASLQETYAPELRCFGCGPANEQGLRIRSIPEGDEVVARWRAAPHHEAYPGMVNGGILGALLDCHMNWTAAWHLKQARDEPTPPCTVTAEFTVKLRRPTPSAAELEIRARVARSEGDRAWIEGEVRAGDEVTARGSGLFVAVKEGHPAYHRW